MQTTSYILMIRPVDFKFNAQTAGNNKFQQASVEQDIQLLALKEFDDFSNLLLQNGVDVTVINDTLQPETPDSIFPNNWVSFHENGDVFLYPMFSENRRLERRTDIIDTLRKNFSIGNIVDLSAYEQRSVYLEGTGSMVLDRVHKIAYACLSIRTDKKVLDDFCTRSGYKAVAFNAADASGFPIYHTNVMMCIGTGFAVICLASVPDLLEQQAVVKSLEESGMEIIDISMEQMNRFAGNMLEIQNNNGQNLLVMSEQAYLSLSKGQILRLEQYSKLIYSPLYTIEKNGGGSARCMLAEIHLAKQS
ncbi:MAG TPA: arginine deiminase-related protein [Pedobacter sp.]|nr:arginine deiminase-related protein [Pedobacter sp.]